MLADSLGGEYFEHIASIHEQVPSLLRRERRMRHPQTGSLSLGRGPGWGGRVWNAGHSGL